MIAIRRASTLDAAAIAAVHVAAWQDTYAGILPTPYLANLSRTGLVNQYHRGIQDRSGGHAVFVATDGDRVVGFASGGRSRRGGLAAGEVHTLYLLDDYRDQGLGRRLLRAMAAHLSAIGCGSVMLWVLAANPSFWFYRHLAGRPVARETIRVAGQAVEQVAIRWEPIDSLLAATASAP
jgi:GNAT superfamily N-acetyltransferase